MIENNVIDFKKAKKRLLKAKMKSNAMSFNYWIKEVFNKFFLITFGMYVSIILVAIYIINPMIHS